MDCILVNHEIENETTQTIRTSKNLSYCFMRSIQFLEYENLTEDIINYNLPLFNNQHSQEFQWTVDVQVEAGESGWQVRSLLRYLDAAGARVVANRDGALHLLHEVPMQMKVSTMN